MISSFPQRLSMLTSKVQPLCRPNAASTSVNSAATFSPWLKGSSSTSSPPSYYQDGPSTIARDLASLRWRSLHTQVTPSISRIGHIDLTAHSHAHIEHISDRHHSGNFTQFGGSHSSFTGQQPSTDEGLLADESKPSTVAMVTRSSPSPAKPSPGSKRAATAAMAALGTHPLVLNSRPE